MAAPAQLTPGAVTAVSEHADGNGTLQPVLQVVDVRMVNNVKNPSSDRFRMVLSDGVYTLQSMLATAENTRVRDGSIGKGSIIHLQEFTCSTIQNRRIIIIIKLDVLQSECGIIGNPRPYEMRDQPKEQVTNLPANAAQANSGTYSSGPGMLGSSVAPRPAQVVADNVPHSGSYGAYPGTVGPPVGRAAESVPNVASGVPYGTTPEHNTMNVGMVQSNLQRPSLNSNQNQRFAVPAMGGGASAVESVPNVASSVPYVTTSAHNTMNVSMVQSNLQRPSLNSHQNQRFAVPGMSGGSSTPGNTYGHSAQSYQQPPPGHMNRGPLSKNEVTHLFPVAKLTPYQERWTIKARVTAKTDLKHYNNKNGPGKVFSFDVVDGQGGEIRATCFNTQADKFFDLIEVDKVYQISKGQLKPANKKFNSLNHEYEITLDSRTTIEVCLDDNSGIPRQQYNFRPICEIENIEIGAIVDLIGIVTSVGPSATIMRRDGSEARKRTLQLKDMSGRSVEITLWGKFCDAEGQQLQSQCDSGSNPVLSLKSVRVTEFSGRSVSSIGSSQLKIDPDFPEAETLRNWYVAEGKTAASVSLSVVSMGRTDVRKTIVQIKDENLGRSEKPDWITVKGAISHMPTDNNFCYPACTLEVNGRVCNKKVINNGDGTWHCDKCDQSLPNCEYRYMMQCQLQDHTGVTYATAFQEAGLEMIGHRAHELYNMKEEDPERFAEILQGVRWQQFLFKLKVKEETFNDEARVKCTIVKAEKLDPARESSYLLGVINGLMQDDTGSPSEVQGPRNDGLNNVGAGRNVPTPIGAYTTSMSGPRYGESANQFAQQANTYGGAPTPMPAAWNVQTCMSCGLSGHNAQNCPAGRSRQQPAASTTSSYASSPGNAASELCSRCHQPGHFETACPQAGASPQQQPYRSGGASSGGYGRPQSYVGAPNY